MTNNNLTDGVIDAWFNAAKAAIHHPATTRTEHSHAFAAYMLAQEVRALRAELQQRRKADEQEPVAWIWRWSDDEDGFWRYSEEIKETKGSVTAKPLYAAPTASTGSAK
ncbi:hypothetical protein [Pluralibacter sp.]|uniref:hypothetical protein n=1 Tax=Pluralibacter sp. TaxID=1920032 RepID=UPI0025F087E7|nr:hypothetical protein [Pluralibacter sp.]MBV8045132.1 hypothetical protein [Pluralibacter sp.]